MGRRKLTAAEVAKLKAPGRHPVGESLFLQVSPAGRASWSFRYARNGRNREIGLGGYPVVTYAAAREAVLEVRRQLHAGLDPLAARRQPRAVTFAEAARQHVEAHAAGWRSPKSAIQWMASLRDHALPVIGAKSVAEISVEDVLAVLKPLWAAHPVTAARVRGRIEVILDGATARGLRTGPNPAQRKGNLDHLLPRIQRTVRHHPAISADALPGVIERLTRSSSTNALACRFTALTAARVGEVVGATWSEIDIENAVWVISANRMKNGVEHRQPLSRQALAVIAEAGRRQQNDWVFPGMVDGKAASQAGMMKTFRAAGGGQTTLHGLRSTFRVWAAEVARAPHEVAEIALAHEVGSRVSRAYQRSDLLDQRRELLQQWGDHLSSITQVGVKIS